MGRAKKEFNLVKKIVEYQNKLKDEYGFDWESIDGVIDKLKEEIFEFENALKQKSNQKIKEEFGDIFITLVNISRFLNFSVYEILSESFSKFKKRVKKMEKEAKKRNLNLKNLNIDDLDKLWEKIKKI